ncbi:MAG: hypothetical protein HOL28_06725 [Crocinitomicaceae bacterium]|jgi:hypothetical protein|nr:hypothetical protein [Crocinitomicaceae bacterium]MBT5403125.1 hypothetical protein [Crocinitomicaceae bacterium]MBT6513613.1 hypothetical protein [Crocinitomicaceae bacterium]
MNEQNFKNHKSLVLGYHYISFFSIVALLIGTIVYLIQNLNEQLFLSALLVIGSFSLLIVWHYSRAFAAKAQDRAIRAEENFRHYILTGKPISENLTTLQIVGLRFASDEEFVALAERAQQEKMSQLEIKKAIKNWRANTYRV